MITIKFYKYSSFTTVEYQTRSFTSFDDFLKWYFKDGNPWMMHTVLEGREIILGEVKQKGINNK